jgi:hypothetical protein
LPLLAITGLVATEVVPQLGAGAKLVAGAEGTLVEEAPNPDVAPNPVEGVLGVPKLLVGVVVCAPPLFAPFSFSCVRPNAAIPKTAPIAMWNNPAPCSVSGFHCVIGV